MAETSSKTEYSQKQPRDDLTAEYVRSILNYDPLTGIIWYKPRAIRPGYERFDRTWNARYAVPKKREMKDNSYLHLRIDGVIYKAHRIAWLHYYGVWPSELLDHENTIRSDNRIENLRDADFSKNTMNSCLRSDNACHFKGVDYMPKKRKWRARIGINGRNIYLGLFDTPEDAHAAYVEASQRLHGEYARAA